MPATPISSTLPDHLKNQIIECLVGAAFTLHSGGNAILEVAKTLCGEEAVSESVEMRKSDEKMMGTNGGFGEGGALTSLSRAYILLSENGEQDNAEQVRKLSLGRFLREQFEGEVEKVKAGW